MGRPKGELVFGAEPLVERIVRVCAECRLPVTVQGGKPVAGAAYSADRAPHGGPVANLRGLAPTGEWVLLCGCDLVRFHAAVIRALWDARSENHLAIVPSVRGRLQPMCALYRARAFELLSHRAEIDRMMAWLDALDPLVLDESRLASVGVDPRDVLGANTPQEFRDLAHGLGP